MATCKGLKKDGTPCQSPIVLANGYCARHQDHASVEDTPQTEEPCQAQICECCGDPRQMLLCAGAVALLITVIVLVRKLARALRH